MKSLLATLLRLKKLRPLFALAVLLLVGGLRAEAQILDDSTKILYGPKTTRLIYEDEILRDSTSGTQLDTTLTRWPQARFWFHDTTYQQDLGTVGSASRPLLFQPNLQLGARFGRNAFDKYARDAGQIPYYDSRSPYSFFRLVQSGEGEQVFEISYSRSLRKNFSVGLAYERFASNIILASNTNTGLVEHSNLLFFGRYQTEDERYHLVFNFSNVRHLAVEQGGIWPLVTRTRLASGRDSLSGETRIQDLFQYDRERVYLTKAQNTEERDEFRFTQTYRLLDRGLTVYHTFDAKRQYNSYYDQALLDSTGTAAARPGSLLYYPNVLRNGTATLDRAEFRQVENTVGVLGRTQAVEYQFYGRFRNADVSSQTLSTVATGSALLLERANSRLDQPYNQVFLGGKAAFNYRTIYAVQVAGELKLASKLQLVDEYWLRASIRTGPLSAEALSTSYSPTLTQQEFVGNHYQWLHTTGSNPFNNTSVNQLSVRLFQPLPFLSDHSFEAKASLVNINNLVYYNADGLPAQVAANQQLLIGFARHRVRIGRVGFDNQATYTRGGDVTGLRIPSFVSTSRVYYQAYIFRRAMFTQTGFEVNYQSRFRAYDYSPSNQQFYVQDHFTIRNNAVADVFFVADIKTVSVFLKVAYLNQGILHDGYFTSPYYTAYPRRFQLGVKWMFFS